MDTAGWLQMLVPSGVAALAALLVWQASKRADKTQRDSMKVELRKIEDDLRNQCVVELHRQRIAACLSVVETTGKCFTHLWSFGDDGPGPQNKETIEFLNRQQEAWMRGCVFLAEKTIDKYQTYYTAFLAWQRVLFIAGEEQQKYVSALASLHRCLREDVGVEALPDKLFQDLFSKMGD